MISEMTKKEAVERFNELEKKGFENLSEKDRDVEFRSKMMGSLNSLNKRIEEENLSLYHQDLLLALKLFEILNEVYDFSEREASQDGKWRFLSLNVVPELIHNRWGFNESRFYQHSSRMYLKSLWWYIYLSWQGTGADTYSILRGNTTDELVQLVERTGSKGYRVDVYRKVMKYYSEVNTSEKQNKNEIFRKVMKLNTARVKIIEPALYKGGTSQYVKELFDYFD